MHVALWLIITSATIVAGQAQTGPGSIFTSMFPPSCSPQTTRTLKSIKCTDYCALSEVGGYGYYTWTNINPKTCNNNEVPVYTSKGSDICANGLQYPGKPNVNPYTKCNLNTFDVSSPYRLLKDQQTYMVSERLGTQLGDGAGDNNAYCSLVENYRYDDKQNPCNFCAKVPLSGTNKGSVSANTCLNLADSPTVTHYSDTNTTSFPEMFPLMPGGKTAYYCAPVNHCAIGEEVDGTANFKCCSCPSGSIMQRFGGVAHSEQFAAATFTNSFCKYCEPGQIVFNNICVKKKGSEAVKPTKRATSVKVPKVTKKSSIKKAITKPTGKKAHKPNTKPTRAKASTPAPTDTAAPAPTPTPKSMPTPTPSPAATSSSVSCANMSMPCGDQVYPNADPCSFEARVGTESTCCKWEYSSPNYIVPLICADQICVPALNPPIGPGNNCSEADNPSLCKGLTVAKTSYGNRIVADDAFVPYINAIGKCAEDDDMRLQIVSTGRCGVPNSGSKNSDHQVGKAVDAQPVLKGNTVPISKERMAIAWCVYYPSSTPSCKSMTKNYSGKQLEAARMDPTNNKIHNFLLCARGKGLELGAAHKTIDANHFEIGSVTDAARKNFKALLTRFCSNECSTKPTPTQKNSCICICKDPCD